MAMSKSQTQNVPSSVEMLGARLQKTINSPGAQKNRSAVLYKAPEEMQEDWDQIIEAINDTDGVHVIFHDDGGAEVHWEVPQQD
ncbi:hypothetical protein PS3A_13010 [Pseudomonas sp. 3A(2025)]